MSGDFGNVRPSVEIMADLRLEAKTRGKKIMIKGDYDPQKHAVRSLSGFPLAKEQLFDYTRNRHSNRP